jgi:DNA-directed RNA polymerase specialized sigma24 family protein
MNTENIEREETGRMSPTDNELMEDVRDGRVEKLAVLFERYQTMLYNFFLRLTGNRAASEDLVQDVFMRVLKFVETPSREPLPEAAYEADQEAELVRRALDRLPVQKRELLVLFRFQNLKLREIAELLGCQVGTVKAQVHRALKDLSRIYLDLQGGKVS